MSSKKYSTTQIIKILKEFDSGVSAKELCRTHGMNPNTFYKWKSKYGGLEVNEAQRLKSMEDENRRLKQIVADLSLDNQALKAVLEKKW